MIPSNSPLVEALSPYWFGDIIRTSIVTYGFDAPGGVIETFEFTGGVSRTVAWTAAQKQYVRDTLTYISSVIDLRFVERTSGNMTIEFSQVPTLGDDVTGFADVTGFGDKQIVLPTDFIMPVVYGYDNVTVIHEIGHALGLSHPFEGPASLPGVKSPYDPGSFSVNSELATRMSYLPGYSATYPNLDIWGEPFSFGAIDIAALQLLYGANTDTGRGNTVYRETPSELITIWDNGGTDTIDYRTAASSVVIDLRAATLENNIGGGGYLSFIDFANGTIADGGYTIAYGVDIENAVGGSGNDRLGGNALANTLTGGRGDDRIDGRGGVDTAVYSGKLDSYSIKFTESATTITDRRANGDGVDRLIDIEKLKFADETFDIGIRAGAADLSAQDFAAITELYIAYFDRAPASKGLLYWATRLADGMTLPEIAESFFVQPETQRTYASFLNNAGEVQNTQAFVTAVFNNVLGRNPSSQYWVNELEKPNSDITPAIFILAVLNGAKAVTGGRADAAYLDAKADIGVYFSAIKGLSDYNDSVSVMEMFTGTQASLNSAVAEIDKIYADALHATDGQFIMQLAGVIDNPFA